MMRSSFRNGLVWVCAWVVIVMMLPAPSFSSSESTPYYPLPKPKPKLKIVHLGDSYSAGNGARNERNNRNYVGVEGCHRSPTNWGSQFADSLRDTFNVTYINKACSGGVVNDILDFRDMKDRDSMSEFSYDGKQSNEVGKCPGPSYPGDEIWQVCSGPQYHNYLLRWEWTCGRYLNPQIDAIDESVDLVLMTGGGNDVGFSTVVAQCFAFGPRDAEGCQSAVNNARNEIENLKERLVTTFAELRKKMRPDARIIFVTYPYLSPDVDDYLLGRDNYNAANEIRILGKEGDKIQKKAIKIANDAAAEDFILFFDDTKAIFEGHLPDPSVLKTNPDTWLHEFVKNPLYMMIESYHYNPLGHQNLADYLSLFEAMEDAKTYFNSTLDKSEVDVDVAFVIDTTGSMGDEIETVRKSVAALVNQISTTTKTFRISVVSYRDYPERTGDDEDYPSRLVLDFTNDLAAIQNAINSLTLGHGGDWEETVYSGVNTAIGLQWRPGVKKIALVIGDAPALSPEPVSNLTATQIVANSIAVDPVQIFGVNVGSLDENGVFSEISTNTGGKVLNGTSDLIETISEILDMAATEPYAWIGEAYSGKIGEPVQFDARGSYDPTGADLTLYEWDFDADGIFEYQTPEPITTHTYNSEFNDIVVMRVTGAKGTALASARTVVNAQGYAPQGDEAPCAIDENGNYILTDEEGRPIPCTINLEPTPTVTLGDLDGDGDVDLDDYLRFRFRAVYGTCQGDSKFIPAADMDSDGCITANDYDILRGLM